MRKTARLTIAAVTVPLLAATGVGAANAASDPSEVVITELSGQYLGPLSSAGKVPKITIEATEVSKAFTSYTTVKTARKVAKSTDGEAEAKGTIVKTPEGFRCKATSFKTINPGTAGMYEKVNWKCTFKAADTPTEITLTYKQSSL
jgi:hypothetical protein